MTQLLTPQNEPPVTTSAATAPVAVIPHSTGEFTSVSSPAKAFVACRMPQSRVRNKARARSPTASPLSLLEYIPWLRPSPQRYVVGLSVGAWHMPIRRGFHGAAGGCTKGITAHKLKRHSSLLAHSSEGCPRWQRPMHSWLGCSCRCAHRCPAG